ncbi:MAG: TIGR03000 domain-containing protein, partial [Gemmataceae bacterium]
RYITPPTRTYGLNVFSYRSAVARLCTPSVSVWPAVALSPTSAGCARLEVRLPHQNAEVYVNRQPTAATGTERVFESPPLEAGREFGYEVVAKWVENGEPKAATRTITVTAGNTQVVDFSK